MNAWSWSFEERSVNVSRKCCQGMKWLAVGAVFYVAIDIAKVESDLELFLCDRLNSSNSYSTGNPWSKRIDARGP